jgi:hypothetical protein
MEAQTVLKFVHACRNDDGGFGLYPGDGSNLLATFSGVQVLGMLKAGLPDPDKTCSFVLSRQNSDGGFRNRWGIWPKHSTLINTFYAVKTLESLGRLPDNPDAIEHFIHSRQEADGGYFWDYWLPPEDTARSGLRETYCAVLSLAALGRLPQNLKPLLSFLRDRQKKTQHKDGSFNFKNEKKGGDTPRSVGLVCYTGMGLKTLETLEVPPWKSRKSAAYLHGRQEIDGGFSKGMGVFKTYYDRRITRIEDAYWAVTGLKSLGENVKNPKGLARWIELCLRSDGGFSRRPDYCPSELNAVFCAVSVLCALRETVPAPKSPVEPARENDKHELKYTCAQIDPKNFDEIRYLRRIAKPLYDRFIASGEIEVAKQILIWVGDNLLFTPNYKHSGALIIIDGLATCGPQARAYVSLANAVDIESRMVYIRGHGVAESRIKGRWIMMDPIFYDWGHDISGNLKSAFQIHQNAMAKKPAWTPFGDFRYLEYSIQLPDASLYKISPETDRETLIKDGVYTEIDLQP